MTNASRVCTAQHVSVPVMNALLSGESGMEASSEHGDNWSVGVMLYQMVTGHLPVPGPDKFDKLLTSSFELSEEDTDAFYEELCSQHADWQVSDAVGSCCGVMCRQHVQQLRACVIGQT